MSSVAKAILTQDYLKEILHYNPSTGAFVWTENKQWRQKKTGYMDKDGYHIIMIDGRNYRAHRLAWLYVYGEFPPHQTDHINHDRADNRISNLRSVTNQENQMNRRFTGNSSGFRGVYWDKPREKWASKIKVNQKMINIGRFDSIEEAIGSRLTAEIEYGFHFNHGTIL